MKRTYINFIDKGTYIDLEFEQDDIVICVEHGDGFVLYYIDIEDEINHLVKDLKDCYNFTDKEISLIRNIFGF